MRPVSGSLGSIRGEERANSHGPGLPAGSFFALSPGMARFAYDDEDTVIQLNSTGPWALTYVNPKDDPRQKTQ